VPQAFGYRAFSSLQYTSMNTLVYADCRTVPYREILLNFWSYCTLS
jgi:hypothetical protein